MSSYRADPTRPDKAKAIAAVIGVYAAIIAAVLLIPADSPLKLGDAEPTVLIEIQEPPEPQPPPEQQSGKTEEDEGAAGKKAEPTPVVAPKPPIPLPATPPIAAAPIAGSGSATTAGSATSGTGSGAGGSGTGRGGGGGGGGLGSEARLLGGNSAKLPSQLLRPFSADHGFGYLLLTVAESGRVTDCSVLQTTGQGPVDEALCNIMIKRSRWEPARDRQGNAVTVTIRYTATWKKN